jgi:hypothetical protein
MSEEADREAKQPIIAARATFKDAAAFWIKLSKRPRTEDLLLLRFGEWFGVDRLVSDVEQGHVQRFALERLSSVGGGTLRNELGILSAFMRWALDFGYTNKALKMPWPEYEPKRPVIPLG